MKRLFFLMNIVLVVLFLVLSAMIWLRGVDGSGVIQTTNLRWAAFIILVIFYFIILITEIIIFFIIQRTKP